MIPGAYLCISLKYKVMKKKLQGIYGILNHTNQKIYIGSSINIYSRWYVHKNDLKRNKHSNQHLQNAWNKYKESSFSFIILEKIEISTDDKKEINRILWELESKWIANYNSTNRDKGYNINDPLRPTQDPATIEKCRKGAVDWLTENLPTRVWKKWKSLLPEEIAKTILEERKLVRSQEMYLSVREIKGNIYKEYRKAQNGKPEQSWILKDNIFVEGGFDYQERIGYEVIVLDTEGNKIYEFEGATEAAENLNFPRKKIEEALIKKNYGNKTKNRFTYRGFQFFYKKDYNPENDYKLVKPKRQKKQKIKKVKVPKTQKCKLLNILTNEEIIFNSVKDVLSFLNVGKNYLYERSNPDWVIQGKYKFIKIE
jgi:group I intron endonuclease